MFCKCLAIRSQRVLDPMIPCNNHAINVNELTCLYSKALINGNNSKHFPSKIMVVSVNIVSEFIIHTLNNTTCICLNAFE